MSKRTMIVIGCIVMLPILITLFFYMSFRADNPVVAVYDGDVSRISYNGKTLIAVEGEAEYRFRYGEYIGRVGDSTYGSSFYRVLDDDGEIYYAVADRDKNILYTESGTIEDGVKTENGTVTRVVFDDYRVIIEGEDARSVSCSFAETSAQACVLKPSEHKGDDGSLQYRIYDVWFSYDGSAILTENAGRLYYLTEEMKWVFVPIEIYEAAIEEYGENSKKLVFSAYEIVDSSARLVLSEYIPQ